MKKQLGMTLIELMIALVLGLIITAAAMQLFLTGSINYNLQKAMTELQDNGNFGLNYILKDIRLANLPLNLTGDKAGIKYLTHGEGQEGWGGSTNINEYASDQLVIQYKAFEAGAMDCEGVAVTQSEIDKSVFIIQRYFLRQDGGDLALACDAGRYETLLENADLPTNITDFGGNGQVILRRVDHFHILLGIKDNVKDEFKYVTVKDYMGTKNTLVKDAASRPRIMSIQIGALMRGFDAIPEGQNVPDQFQILDQKVSLKTAAKQKKYIREVVSQTIALRNGYGLMEEL